jgi:hypothetical protein
MGETRKEALRVDFDGRTKLEFHGVAVTSDAGRVAYRELDEALGLAYDCQRYRNDEWRSPKCISP